MSFLTWGVFLFFLMLSRGGSSTPAYVHVSYVTFSFVKNQLFL